MSSWRNTPNSPYAEAAQELIDKLFQELDQDASKHVAKSKKQGEPPPETKLEKPPLKVPDAPAKPPQPPPKQPAGIPEMVLVAGGTFQMGSKDEFYKEEPVHQVTIPSFYLGKYPVTFEEYDRFCEATNCEKPADEGWGRGRRPVIHVSWEDAQAYCDWLSSESGQAFRLPSEAEWEFAGKGGIHSKGYKYAGSNELDKVAWYYKNSGNKTHPVGEKAANELGLHDMSGNVWEWCADTWHENYKGAPDDGKAWTSGGDNSLRALRGGSWDSNYDDLRLANRGIDDPLDRYYDGGFRVARH